MMLAFVWLWISIHRILANEYDDHKNQLQTIHNRSARMYNNSNMSDIKFTYKDCRSGEEFYAHKYMLAIASPDFQGWFYGETAIRNLRVIDLPDISKEVLAAFLAFIYKDECPKRIDIIFDVLRLTKEYKVPSLVQVCKSEFEKVFAEVEKKLLREEHGKADELWRYIDQYADIFFSLEYFLKIEKNILDTLLARDTLPPNEKLIFDAVKKWADYQCQSRHLEQTRENRRAILGDAIYQIRFHTMSSIEFSRYSGDVFRELLYDSETLDLQNIINGGSAQSLEWDTSLKKREVINQLQSRLPSGVFMSSIVNYVEQSSKIVNLIFIFLGIFAACANMPWLGVIVGMLSSYHTYSMIYSLCYPDMQLNS